MTYLWRQRPLWLLGLLLLLALVAAACTDGGDPAQFGVGPSRWQLTISPQEPAAGIKAEVALQQFGPDGRRRPYSLVSSTPIPTVRALSLDGAGMEWAKPREIDHRGAWMYDIVLPSEGRWQIAFDPVGLPMTEAQSTYRWPTLPNRISGVVRDAVGDENISLLVTVIPDRGPILWWMRTHMLEVGGFIFILTASVVSYVIQRRRTRAPAGGV